MVSDRSQLPRTLALEDGRVLQHDTRPLPPVTPDHIEYRAYSLHGLFVIASRMRAADGEDLIISLSHDGGFSATPQDVLLVGKALIPDGGVCVVQGGVMLPHVTLILHRVGHVNPGQQRTMHISGHLKSFFPSGPFNA